MSLRNEEQSESGQDGASNASSSGEPSAAAESSATEKESDDPGSLSVTHKYLTNLRLDEASTSNGTMNSQEGIEVEAVEFSKKSKSRRVLDIVEDANFYIPRRPLLLIAAFFVTMTTSAISGFAVLGQKKSAAKNAAASSALMIEVNGASNEIELPSDLDGTLYFEEPTDPPETAEPTKSPTEAPTEVPTESPTKSPTESPTEFPTQSPTESPTSSSTSFPTLAPVTPEPTVAATEQITTKLTPGATSGIGGFSWSDHDLSVTSSCVQGSDIAVSMAAFRFGSKRDGDWYWVRGVNDINSPTRDYDSWDYTEQTEGQMALSGLNSGNYVMSLVRDSMQPYDQIITFEFTVPDCAANIN
mmetsp:Transcript_16805/g.38519  ORF Transcript_16805/g.38519 Transcript_16805/m.38519 type:complete len:358 (-) Transcript_16805:226-1299(-)